MLGGRVDLDYETSVMGTEQVLAMPSAVRSFTSDGRAINLRRNGMAVVTHHVTLAQNALPYTDSQALMLEVWAEEEGGWRLQREVQEERGNQPITRPVLWRFEPVHDRFLAALGRAIGAGWAPLQPYLSAEYIGRWAIPERFDPIEETAEGLAPVVGAYLTQQIPAPTLALHRRFLACSNRKILVNYHLYHAEQPWGAFLEVWQVIRGRWLLVRQYAELL